MTYIIFTVKDGRAAMRVTAEEKQRSRERIVRAAARRFRDFGINGASVGDIMGEAGMTHGGFYRHFDGKDDLLAAAIAAAFDDFVRPLATAADHEGAVHAFRARYLTMEHRANRGEGCPAAALGVEVARAGAAARAAFGAGLRRISEELAGPAAGTEARAVALRDFATMVGALVLARAVDDASAENILAACRTGEPAPSGNASRAG